MTTIEERGSGWVICFDNNKESKPYQQLWHAIEALKKRGIFRFNTMPATRIGIREATGRRTNYQKNRSRHRKRN